MKKLLLSIVPALMLLGSCSGAQPQVENKLFQEMTVAQEEVAKKAHKNEITPAVTPKAPKVGVRVKDHKNGYHSIRFLAAITADDLSTIKASWTRTMYLSTGGIQKETRSNITCTYAYTQLVDEKGTGTIKITDGEYAGYNCFVVYTMTNVPDAYLGSYLNAQLTIDSEDNEFDFITNIVSSTIDESKQVSFPASKTGYFLTGTICGEDDSYVTSNDSEKGDNLAAFITEYKENDTFLIVKNDTAHDEFFIYNSSSLLSTNEKTTTYLGDNGGKIKVKYSAGLSLYFNNDEKLLCGAEWAPEKSIWLSRNGVWRKYASLIDNPSASGELMAQHIELQAGDVFGLKLTQRYIGYISDGNSGNFIVDGGNITVKADKDGDYSFYVYNYDGYDLSDLAIWEDTDTLDVTFNVNFGEGSKIVSGSWVGIKYRARSSDEYDTEIQPASLIDNTWTINSSDKIKVNKADNDFEFFIEAWASDLGDGDSGNNNAKIWSAISSGQIRFVVTVTDKTQPIVINVTTGAITNKSHYAAVSKSGTNCTVI